MKENIFLDNQYMIGGIKTEAGKNRQILIANKILPIVKRVCDSTKKKLLEMSQDSFYKNYWAAIDRTGARKLSPHCCMHTCATVLAEEGILQATIKEILGHRIIRLH